ncbi:hypothetical protein [Bradyrhizobium sp. USDA 10063]
MGGIWKKGKRPKQEGGKPKPPPPPAPHDEDDDYEDGDIATPKRDRYGPDDEPL